MKRLIVFLAMCCLSFAAIYAEDDVNVVIPTNKSTNYALYPAITGVFLKLDTRDGTIQAIVPSNPKKNRVINAEPLAKDKKPGRFELYPTDNSWVWVLFDSETGNMWNVNLRTKQEQRPKQAWAMPCKKEEDRVNWSAKSNALSRIPDSVAETTYEVNKD